MAVINVRAEFGRFLPGSRPLTLASTTPNWLKDGLRFECLPDCAACCVNHDDYSTVYLTSDDAVALAKFFKISLETFLERHAVLEDGELALHMEGDDCVFLEGTRCGVYAARPLQCRTFPFWPRFLKSAKTWKDLTHFCPGIDQGKKHTLLQIRAVAKSYDSSGIED